MDKGKVCIGLAGLWIGLSGYPCGATGVKDDLGIEVGLATSPQRIISLAPNNTELLFALGLGEKLVGVTEYCDYPEAAQSIDRVGGYSTMSVEKIVAADPDLVVGARGNDPEGLETLRQMEIKVFALDIQTVDQLLLAVQRLGALTGAEAQAEILRQAWKRRVEQVKAAVDTLAERPGVLWGYWGETVYTAGKGNVIDDVIHLAGGENVGRAAPGTWPQVSVETIVSWAPQVIVTTYLPGHAGEDFLQKEIARLQGMDGWKSVSAVRKGRIYYVESDWLMRPGPRLIDALEQMAALFHPGEFKEP